MFDKAGLPYPTDQWTMNDLRETAKKLTKDTNGDGKIDQWGFSTDLWDMELFWSSAVWGHGGEILDQEYTKTLLGEPKARDAFHFINGLMVEDKSMPDPDTVAQFGNDAFQTFLQLIDGFVDDCHSPCPPNQPLARNSFAFSTSKRLPI
jgi:multiple sugar transport system substrate-binding protein